VCVNKKEIEMDSVYWVLLVIHVVMAMVLATAGPVYVYGTGVSISHKIVAYLVSLFINLLGFWPITLGLVLKNIL